MQTIEKQKATDTSQAKPQGPSETERAERWLAWIKANQRRLTIAATAIVVVVGGIWFTISARARRETFARRELDQARVSAEAGNLPLAATDLSRVISSYSGTRAGQEAVLLLAQVRLLQDQGPQAVTELQEFIDGAPAAQYRAPAYSALGAALEQTGRPAEAGVAYENGADASEYELLAARLLIEAGRAYATAADTASAVRVYQRIVRQHSEAAAATEARLRLGELGRYEAVGGQ